MAEYESTPPLSDETRRHLQELWAQPLPIEVPEYESFSYEDVDAALKKIRVQWIEGQPLVWTGPDALHSSVLATNGPPSWHFSEEGMQYHAEQGRSFWDVYTLVAFQIGFSNGAVRESRWTRR